MKRALYICIFALTALLAAAQPTATWLERQHDFGVFLEKNGKVSCQMRVVNTGNEPLLIVKAQVGCGCTGITYPETPIQPGDTALVGITYNPSGRPGQFSKQAIIFPNTEIKRTILEISGNVIPTDATLNKQYPLQAGALRISQRNIPFGELTKGVNKTLFLSAFNSSTDTILVTVTGEKPHLKPAVVPDTVPPAKVTAISVVGVDASPIFTTSTPQAHRVPTTRCSTIGPESLASLPTTTLYFLPSGFSFLDGRVAQ